MKTLIIVAHPNVKDSIINKRWIQELSKYPDKYTINNLYTLYPNEDIDVQREQKLLEEHDKVIFQFPFYWFNCPPLLKKWLDKVLTHGWAYGKNSDYRLKNKKIALAVSAGILEIDFRKDGRYQYTLQELTAPFEISFKYVKANYRPLFAFYGAEHDFSLETLEESAINYIDYIEAL